MRRFPCPRICLLGLLAALFLYAACGQNEGGRCQVTSDCASGLVCSEFTGNGVCRSPNLPGNNDAALKSDLADDLSAPLSSEVGSEATATPAIDADTDAETIDTGSVD